MNPWIRTCFFLACVILLMPLDAHIRGDPPKWIQIHEHLSVVEAGSVTEGPSWRTYDLLDPIHPVCVQSPSEPHNRLILVINEGFPHDAVTLHAEAEHTLALSNGWLRLEGAIEGQRVDMKFLCTPDGKISMAFLHVSGNPDYHSLVRLLQSRGYDEALAKYVVVYFAGPQGIDGLAFGLRSDDRPTEDNKNNRGPTYAFVHLTDAEVDRIKESRPRKVHVLLHEWIHTMGAVQFSAPNFADNHCLQGRDVMCYDSAKTGMMDQTICDDRQYIDCMGDDYFNLNPPEGSYLATHWNIASPMNHYLDIRPDPDAAWIVTPAPRAIVKGDTVVHAEVRSTGSPIREVQLVIGSDVVADLLPVAEARFEGVWDSTAHLDESLYASASLRVTYEDGTTRRTISIPWTVDNKPDPFLRLICHGAVYPRLITWEPTVRGFVVEAYSRVGENLTIITTPYGEPAARIQGTDYYVEGAPLSDGQERVVITAKDSGGIMRVRFDHGVGSVYPWVYAHLDPSDGRRNAGCPTVVHQLLQSLG